MDMNAPAKIPGASIGSVTRLSVCHSFAPRSIAASSIERSKSAILARSVMITKGRQNVT